MTYEEPDIPFQPVPKSPLKILAKFGFLRWYGKTAVRGPDYAI
jgi:hypothetical protein